MIQPEKLEIITLTKSEQASILSAVTQMVADLLQTPGMEEQFKHLYQAQQNLARLFGCEPDSVDTVLANTMTYREAFRNNPGSKEHTRMRVSQPPDAPSSPRDLLHVGYVGQTQADDCCETEPCNEWENGVDERLSAVERENVRLTERMNRIDQRYLCDVKVSDQRTDTIQKEVQHWHTRITELHNELQRLKQSLADLERETLV